MLLEFLTYDLKVAVLIAVFYMFYRLILARETFHRVNRIVLLLTALASYLLPLCVITMHRTVKMEGLPMVTLDDLQMDAVIAESVAETPLWQILLSTLFIIGMVVTLGYTLMSMFRILMLIKRCEKHLQPDGITICVTDNTQIAPFSWMHYIVMNRNDYEVLDSAILAHERGHIRLHHSWDLLLVDTLTALQWFNPAMWMLRSDLRAIHEYEADGAVLSQGINAHQYQYLLITKAGGIGGYSIANGINHSALKNRITMMTNKTSKNSRLLKLLVLIPIVGITFALNARTVTDYVYDEPQKQMPVKKGKANATVKTGSGQDIQIIESVVTADENPQASDVEKFVMKGKVFDGEDKSAIVGAVVTIQGSKKGSVTDKDGNFCLEVSVGDRIEVMYVGYDTYTIGVSKAYAKDRTYMIALYKDGTSPNKEIYDQAETMPEFPGGVGKLMEYVAMNVRYPKEAEDKCLQGRVIATFIVEKDGSITSAKIVRSIDPALDAEALRVINGMPNWKPGTQKGEPVRVKYTIPISFRLQGGGDIPAENVKGANVMNETVVVGYGSENEPYVIVDGKPIDGSKLKEIDPKTIDHMEVLKSQPAIEKYGEKAKNGVIIITTKK